MYTGSGGILMKCTNLILRPKNGSWEVKLKAVKNSYFSLLFSIFQMIKDVSLWEGLITKIIIPKEYSIFVSIMSSSKSHRWLVKEPSFPRNSLLWIILSMYLVVVIQMAQIYPNVRNFLLQNLFGGLWLHWKLQETAHQTAILKVKDWSLFSEGTITRRVLSNP